MSHLFIHNVSFSAQQQFSFFIYKKRKIDGDWIPWVKKDEMWVEEGTGACELWAVAGEDQGEVGRGAWS